MSEPLSFRDKLAMVIASLGIMAIIAACGFVLTLAIVYRAVPAPLVVLLFLVLLGGFIATCRALA
jgi:hypothetical protein